MSHSFAPVPAGYTYYRPGLWACRHCGVFSDKQGADVIQTYPDCSDFDRAISQAAGSNPYAPGESDYPFKNGVWGASGGGGGGAGISSQGLPGHTHSIGGHTHGIGAISGGVCGHGTLDPALTASGLPIRNPQPESGFKIKPAPPKKHVAGIDHEEIDWSAHKEFMKGM